MSRMMIAPELELLVPTLASQPAQPLWLILTRSKVQLLRPPALMPCRPMPWMLTSCTQTLLEALADRPTDAQLPYGTEVRLHAAAALLCADTHSLLSVTSRKPSSTLELPLRFSTLQVFSAPHNFGGAAALPMMRVLAVALGPLGTLPSEQEVRSPVVQVPAAPGAPKPIMYSPEPIIRVSPPAMRAVPLLGRA